MSTTVYAVTFGCADAARLAEFWAAVLDRKVDDGATPDFASIGFDQAASVRSHWMFIKVPEPKQVKNRVHVDLISDTKEREVERLLSIGATHVADFDEDGSQWTTLADPEGNEFDVLAEGPQLAPNSSVPGFDSQEDDEWQPSAERLTSTCPSPTSGTRYVITAHSTSGWRPVSPPPPGSRARIAWSRSSTARSTASG